MWLYLPSTCFPCAPASEASTSESALLCQRLARSVSWREKLSQPPVWRRRLRTVPWMRHLSGPTYSRLTVALGAESWIASVRASRASHTQSPADAKATPTSGHCGPNSSASWTRCDLPWSSSKTSLTLPGIFDPSENDFQAWVIESKDRSISLRRMLALHRNANGSSYWPTPDGSVVNDSEPVEQWKARQRRELLKGHNANGMGTPLSIAARSWATPKLPSGGSQPNPPYRTAGGRFHKLEDQVANWTSPRAEDSESCGNHPDKSDSLNAQARNWGTPTTRDWKDTCIPNRKEPDRSETNGLLALEVLAWSRDRVADLDRPPQGFRLLVQEPMPNGSKSSTVTPNLRPRSTLRLNPRFDCWLMGLPVGWTNYERLEIRSYLCAWRSRLDGLLQRLELISGD